jgi:hypothetical protein
MPARRHKYRPVVNATMEEEMRQLHAMLYSMETVQRRAPDVGNVNESENEEIEFE